MLVICFIKTWTLRFPPKKNLIWKKALFNWPIVLQYDVKKVLGHEVFQPERSLTNQKPCAFVSVRKTKSLYFRSFVVSVFISRSYENRSKTKAKKAFKHKAYPLQNGRRRKRPISSPSLLTRLPCGLADSKQTKMLAAKGTL